LYIGVIRQIVFYSGDLFIINSQYFAYLEVEVEHHQRNHFVFKHEHALPVTPGGSATAAR
jgi:hypothetical protein